MAWQDGFPSLQLQLIHPWAFVHPSKSNFNLDSVCWGVWARARAGVRGEQANWSDCPLHGLTTNIFSPLTATYFSSSCSWIFSCSCSLLLLLLIFWLTWHFHFSFTELGDSQSSRSTFSLFLLLLRLFFCFNGDCPFSLSRCYEHDFETKIGMSQIMSVQFE